MFVVGASEQSVVCSAGAYPLLPLRGVELEVEVLRDGDEVGELLWVGAELVQQRRQRGDEVRRHLGAVVAHHLRTHTQRQRRGATLAHLPSYATTDRFTQSSYRSQTGLLHTMKGLASNLRNP